jgi:hypothetical protein
VQAGCLVLLDLRTDKVGARPFRVIDALVSF